MDAVMLDGALSRMAMLRQRGVLIPAVLEHGTIVDHLFVVYEYVWGRWPARLTTSLLAEMVGVVDAETGAAPAAGSDWVGELRSMLIDGDRLLDVTPSALEGHPLGSQLLEEARTRLDHCRPLLNVVSDIVHRDFAPENVLVHNGRLCAVVDWEQCSTGDARFDLVGLLFDVEMGGKASAFVNGMLRNVLAERLSPELLGAYVAFYAVRYASWAIGTDMEDRVLYLAQRLTFGYEESGES